MMKEKIGPDTKLYYDPPSLVRSDGTFRVNLSLAKTHAINAYALCVLSPDMLPKPMMRRLEEAAELLLQLEENVEYLFRKRHEDQCRPKKKRRSRKT